MRKVTTQPASKILIISERTTAIYLFVMLAVFPLAFHNGYYDILDVKWLVCVASTLLYIMLMGTFLLADRSRPEKRSSHSNRNPVSLTKQKPSKAEKVPYLFTTLYVAAVVAGMLCCEHRAISFWGLTGRYLGVMVMVPLTIALLLISKRYRRNSLVLYGAAISAIMNFVLQILNEFMIDPLHMIDGVSQEQVQYFAGTIGNLNFNAVYDCMILSVAMAIYIAGRDHVGIGKSAGNNLQNALLRGCIILGSAAALCTRSDGAFLGIAVSVIVLFVFALRNTEFADGFLQVATMIVTGFIAISLIYNNINPDRCFKLGSLQSLVIEPLVIATLIIMLIIVFVIYTLLKKKERMTPAIIRMILLVPALIICSTAVFHVIGGSNAIINLSDINDHTAHNRVFVWRNTIGMISTFSPLQMLVGCGINEFRFAFSDYCSAEMLSKGYNVFIDAHSEYLQAIVTTGIAGSVGYFGMIITTLITVLKENTKPGKIADIVVLSFIVSFLIQGLVYSPQIATTPLLFVVLGIFLSRDFADRNK